jgi:hypothetical protein
MGVNTHPSKTTGTTQRMLVGPPAFSAVVIKTTSQRSPQDGTIFTAPRHGNNQIRRKISVALNQGHAKHTDAPRQKIDAEIRGRGPFSAPT